MPTQPSKLTQPTHRCIVQRESVQPAKAARPTNNAKRFTPAPMPRYRGTISPDEPLWKLEKAMPSQISCQAARKRDSQPRMITGVLSLALIGNASERSLRVEEEADPRRFR